MSVWVPGVPLTQGSGDRMLRYDGRGKVCGLGPYVDSSDKQLKGKDGQVTRKSGALTRWKQAIAGAVRMAAEPAVEGPVHLCLLFSLPEPKNPKWWAPAVSRDDLDKLTRAVMDALSGVAYGDDGQVTDLCVRKRYGATSGVTIWVSEASNDYTGEMVNQREMW